MRHLFTLFIGLTLTTAVHAHSFQLADLRLGHPWARATVPGQVSGAAYLSIENTGQTEDKLIALASPAARSTQIHTMAMEDNVMKMREVDSIVIKPAEKISMQSGHGYHIMLIGLKEPLKVGDKIAMTLTFEKAGTVEVSVYVEEKSADGKQGGHH